jgi:uncharacterized protein (DUF58 family)
VRETAQLDAHALRILARRDVVTGLAGAYRSAFRGRGLTFEELRDYVPGDDIRWIEWNATARFARPIIKRMREERDLVLALLVDVSNSLSFGSHGTTKREAVLRGAAALAYAAVAAQDRVAVMTFASEALERVGPGRGPVHLERILRALAEAGGGAPTDVAAALRWANRTLPKHSLVFIVTDLLFPDPGAVLRRCARKHELVVLRVADPADELPRNIAPVRAVPAEEGRRILLRAGRTPGPTARARSLGDEDLRRLGVDVGTLWTGRRLVGSLQQFLGLRAERAI